MIRKIDSKILSRDRLETFLREVQKNKKRVCLCSGVFDLIDSVQILKLQEFKKNSDCLVVGVRSDYGVSLFEDRGVLNNESDRANVLAAVGFIDAVYVFDENSIQESLTFLDSIAAFEVIPNKIHSSVSAFINKYNKLSSKYAEPAPILFLDRDGTIIEHVEYVHEPQKVKIIPGVIQAIKRFQDAGYRVAIVTNQPGINLGYFRKEDLFSVNKVILDECKKEGVIISKIYYSPSASFEDSPWRKPKPGMIKQGLKDLNGIREKSVMVGDSDIDIEAGRKAKLGRLVLISKNPTGSDGFEVSKSLAEISPRV